MLDIFQREFFKELFSNKDFQVTISDVTASQKVQFPKWQIPKGIKAFYCNGELSAVARTY